MGMFVQVYEDSMNRVDGNALVVYELLRRNAPDPVLSFGATLRPYVPPPG